MSRQCTRCYRMMAEASFSHGAKVCNPCYRPMARTGLTSPVRTITITDKGRAVLDEMRRADAMRALHGVLQRKGRA